MTQLVNKTELPQSKDEDMSFRRWKETTKALLHNVDHLYCQPYSICIVPEELRKENQNAYEPKVVSIGPRFKGKRELQQMEEIKWRCTLSLLSRTKGDKTEIKIEILEECMQEMLGLDATVRACYGEEIKLNSYDLATIMVYDGCFLLELVIAKDSYLSALLPHQQSVLMSDLGAKVGEMEAVLSDLTLVENQIPFLILNNLSQRLFPDAKISDSIETKIMLLWQSRLPKQIYPAHLVELVHSTFLWLQNKGDSSVVTNDISNCKEVKLNRCAARLLAAGVHTRVYPGSNTPVYRIHDFNVHLRYKKEGLLQMLQIPHLHITETTEPKWRSFIAWEHHRKTSKRVYSDNRGGSQEFGKSTEADDIVFANVFTFLALLFNDLICCASDVQHLKHKGIIKDELGMSNHDLVTFFRSMANGIDRGSVDSSYANMVNALNNDSATNLVTRVRIMTCHYLSRITDWISGLHKFLWRGYNFAAALVSFLTIVQTIYSVLGYHFGDDKCCGACSLNGNNSSYPYPSNISNHM